jgi:hypothetical protein
MSKPKVDNAKVETVLAAIVLLAVIALFVRFQIVEDHQPAPPPPAVQAIEQPVDSGIPTQ